MTRLTMVLAASMFSLSVAHGSLTTPKERSIFDRPLPPAPKVEPAAESEGGLVISDDTEVKLDGKVCKYEDIPESAEVVLLEVSTDKKSVLKLHFRTKKVDATPKEK